MKNKSKNKHKYTEERYNKAKSHACWKTAERPGGQRMRKKTICAAVVTALAFIAFTGCGKQQSTEAVDTLLPMVTQKPVVTETAVPVSVPETAKTSEETVTAAKAPATVTKEPEAIATSTPKPTATTETTSTVTADNNKPGTTTAGTPAEAPEKTAPPTEEPVPTELPAVTPTPVSAPAATAAPCNHNYVKEYWPSAPTCNAGGYYMLVCSVCGETGGDGTDPALPHIPETRTEVDAAYCDEHGVKVTYCTSCGNEIGREGFWGTEHDWTTGTTDPVWNEEKQDFVTEEVTYCSRCNARP